MPIDIVCPSCTAKLRAPDNAAGRRTKCPKCGNAVVVPAAAENATVATPQRPLSEVVEPAEANPNCGPSPTVVAVQTPFSQATQPIGVSIATSSIQQSSRAAHSLGIAALVIGVLSFFVCWIPVLGIPVSSLGLLLGVGGLVLAVVRGGSGVGFSIGGAGLSAISLVTCIVFTVAVSRVLKAVDDAATTRNGPPQQSSPVSGSNTIAPTKGGTSVPASNPISSPPPPPKVEPEWADAGKPVTLGDIRVQVTKVAVGKVPLKGIGDDESKSEDDLLMVKVNIVNTNPTKKVDYRSWSGENISFDRDYATLKDNFDNSYRRIGFGFSSHPVGAVKGSESIYPNKVVTDVLVFEAPLDTVQFLKLELPGKELRG